MGFWLDVEQNVLHAVSGAFTWMLRLMDCMPVYSDVHDICTTSYLLPWLGFGSLS